MRGFFVLLLALVIAPAVRAATLDGTFVGSYGSSVCGQQGDTKVQITFSPTSANKVKAYVVIYDAPDSVFSFGTDILEYSGTFDAAKGTFSLPNAVYLGLSNGFTYFRLEGTLAGNKIKIKWVGCGGLWLLTKLP